MLGIIAKNQKEMFGATLYTDRDDDQGQYFEFYYTDDGNPSDGQQHITNLLSDGSNETIATSWVLDFARDHFVEIGSNMYRINEIAINRSAGRAFANRVAINAMTEYRLSLVKVGNPKAVYRDE